MPTSGDGRNKIVLSHCLYVESGLITRDSSQYLEACSLMHFADRVFSFTVVPDSFRGLEATEHTLFESIFVHKNLPHLDGLETIRVLRTANYDRAVVLVVDEDDTMAPEDAVQLGFVGVLRKPFTSLQLCEAIAASINYNTNFNVNVSTSHSSSTFETTTADETLSEQYANNSFADDDSFSEYEI